MKIVKPYVIVEKFDGTQIMKRIERACRTCYRSEGKITEDSYKNLIKNCLNRGHESVLEHEKVTVRIYNDIGSYKDLTRHRFASFYIEDEKVYEVWKKTMQEIENSYLEMKKLGATTDMCRNILPHSTAAEYTMTANIREWKHIFELRANNHVHPAIRQVMIPLLKYFKEQMPDIFGDIPYDEEFNPEYYAKLTVEDM